MLVFPDCETLKFCLTSGLIPAEISCNAVQASFQEDGAIVVFLEKEPTKKILKSLQGLGLASQKQPPKTPRREYLCWLQLLPLQRTEHFASDQQPTLFELSEAHLLPKLVTEMLRLGNDRQTFRFVRRDNQQRALLRVVEPPYYSLLRALDRDGQETAPRAYREKSDRVWVEVGYTHPLVEHIKPPEGTFLLLRSSHDWQIVEEAPFRDIYDILEFSLPQAAVSWQDQEKIEPIEVPMRLAPGGSSEPAELWVLRDHALEQMEEFVRSSSDQLLARLSFAVADGENEAVVILRVRPSRQVPPVLVLEAQAFRPYLKLPNLYLPCQTLLHPPLRRDAVRRLLTEDTEQITWLYPHENGQFTPESISDRAFRPLSDWVHYVLTREGEPLQSWIESTQFDFERFICKEDVKSPPKEKEPGAKKDKSRSREEVGSEEAEDTQVEKPISEEVQEDELVQEEWVLSKTKAELSELQKRQAALEKKFRELEGSLDTPERQALWPELAAVYAAQDNLADASVCWVNALWEESVESFRWIRNWQRVSWQEKQKQPVGKVLDKVLQNKEPLPSDLRLVATVVLKAAHEKHPDQAVLQRLNPIQSFIHEHESLLPIRAVWLVALSLCKLSQGDVLALARVRDWLLERLFKTGLMPELDLPGFLRFTGSGFHDRFRVFRDWLETLPKKVERWLKEVNLTPFGESREETQAYAWLILAFGFARLGESESARRLHTDARALLSAKSQDVHSFLLEAFGFRIEEALHGSPPSGSLPSHQMEYLNFMEKKTRYFVDRLRQQSRILEPHEKIDAYRLWYGYQDKLSNDLVKLPDIHDKKELEKTIEDLFRQHASKTEQGQRNRAQILVAALGVAPRIGQSFALSLLGQVKEVSQQLPDILAQVGLLEKALFVAAHFNQPQHMEECVSQFQEFLKSPKNSKDWKALEQLASQSFRGLRKLGMRDTIHELLQQMHNNLTGGKPLDSLRNRGNWSVILRSLLHVASGWFYFGLDQQAKPIVEEAKRLLYKGNLPHQEKRGLACTLVNTLGQAPFDWALRGLEEMFNKLQGIFDTFTTNDYYGQSQLDVIETVVLSIITEDFAVGGMARRWLDEDEFLVRRRIHQDLHAAMKL